MTTDSTVYSATMTTDSHTVTVYIDSYTVTVGQTRVKIRGGADCWVVEGETAAVFPLDHYPVALEAAGDYAKALETARTMRDEAAALSNRAAQTLQDVAFRARYGIGPSAEPYTPDDEVPAADG